MYDIIIIGSGPAGLTAAIYASRARLRTLVLERDTMGAGQIAVTEQVDNYPGLLHIGGYELGEKFREHAESLGASICENDVERLTKQDGVWKVSRLIDNMYRANDDAINAFYENLESADTDGSVPSAAQIVKDMTFQDYISLWDENVGDTPQIYWDGVELEFPDQQPVVQNGVSLAPSRPIVAAMPGEYTVNILQSDPWWKISVEPVGTEPDYWLTFSQGHDGLLPSYTVDYGTADNYDPAQHKEATMNVPVQIVGDRLMLPVRALIEPFADVVWDCGSNIIYIISR